MTPQLHYDSSKSAMIRIFGKIGKVHIHYVSGSNVKLNRYVCPKSINHDSKCSGCQDQLPYIEKNVISGWDCKKDKWCFDFVSDSFIEGLLNIYDKNGINMSCHEDGSGPDIIIQNESYSKTEIQVVWESMGEKRSPKPPHKAGADICPRMEEILEQFEKFSLWKKYLKG